MVCQQIYIWPILVPVYPLPTLHASSDHATDGIEEVKIIGVQISKGNQITQTGQFEKYTDEGSIIPLPLSSQFPLLWGPSDS